MSYAIEIENLSKNFKKTLVIDNICLNVKKGILFSLVGPNGAGKTTLIKILCSLILPCRGRIIVNGYNVLSESQKSKSSIGLVIGDERSFYWRLTGRQNLEFLASLYNLAKKQAKNKIEELLDLLEIEDPDKRFQEYSTGMKQKLSIARSLLNNPEIIFMDEPTKSLDPISAQKLRFFIKEKLVRNQGMTVFFTTHNLNEAEVLSDELAIMHKGKIMAQGSCRELKITSGNPTASMEEVFNHYVNVSS